MMIILGPNGVTIAENDDRPATPIRDPLTGRMSDEPDRPGDHLWQIAESDQVRLEGMIAAGTITDAEADDEAARIRGLRNAAFRARDEAIETERNKMARGRSDKAADFWSPWESRFRELVSEGFTQRAACDVIRDEMKAKGCARSLAAIRKRTRNLLK